MKLLNGAELAGYIKERHSRDVRRLKQSGIQPKLAIVQVKDDPAINTYVRLKRQYGSDIGIEVEVYTPTQKSAPEVINKLNADKSVHGIIVQLPLNDPSDTEKIVNLVAPEKDIDALGNPDAPWTPHSSATQGASEQRTETYKASTSKEQPQLATKRSAETVGGVHGFAGQQTNGVRGSWFEPATPMAIMWLLSGYNIDLAGKKILLVGRGKLVGAPLEKILKTAGHKVLVARKGDDLMAMAKESEVIITATSSPGVLTSQMINPGTVVVDAGVAGEEGKTVGDVDPDVYERDDITITPQKGGVGPLTVCALFENVIRAAQVK